MFYLDDKAPNFSFPDDPIRNIIDKIKLLLFIDPGSYPYDVARGLGLKKLLFENYDEDELFSLIAEKIEPLGALLESVNFNTEKQMLSITFNITNESITLNIPV